MNLTELKLNRNEFDVYVRADIVQAIANGRYIADPSNEHKEWIDQMKGKPFIHVMEAMADLVAIQMRETYGVPPFMASVSYNGGLALIFKDYENAIRGMKRFENMPVVYMGDLPDSQKSKSLKIGGCDKVPLWFLYKDSIKSKTLALACQFAWPVADDIGGNGMLDGLIMAEDATWRDLDYVVNGNVLGVVLKDTKKNRTAVAISGLRSDVAQTLRDNQRYIIATAVPYDHDYDLIAERAISIASLFPIASNEEEDEE
jgi:hypothetical protein|nr:MAG TPA: hypothetical protein [Caudoviricetes sp.]